MKKYAFRGGLLIDGTERQQWKTALFLWMEIKSPMLVWTRLYRTDMRYIL